MASVKFDIAQKLNLHFRVARNGSKVFTVVNTNNTPYALAGTAFQLNLKAFKGAADNILQLTVGAGLTVTDNTLTVAITDEQSNIPEKMYFWELYDSVSKKTWLFGNAYFTTGYPSDDNNATTITVKLDPDTVRITIDSVSDGSGDGTWGAITGDIENQTDLINYLNNLTIDGGTL